MDTVSVNAYTPLQPGGIYRKIKDYFPLDTITNVTRSMYVNGNPVEIYKVIANSYKYGALRYNNHLFFMNWGGLSSFGINEQLNKTFVQFMYSASIANSSITNPDTAGRIQTILENNPNTVFHDATVEVGKEIKRRLKDKGFNVQKSGSTLWASGSYDDDYVGFNLSQSENLIMIDAYTSFDSPISWSQDEYIATASASLNALDVFSVMNDAVEDFLNEIPERQEIFGPELIYTLHNDWSDIPNYRYAWTVGANSFGEHEINSGSVADGDILIRQFITETGSMSNVPYIPVGNWHFSLYGKVDTVEDASIWKVGVYKRNTGGSETLFFTASSDDQDHFSTSKIEWSYQTFETYSIDPTDRLVFKVNAFTDSTGSRTFITYFEGGNRAQIQTPVREQTIFYG